MDVHGSDGEGLTFRHLDGRELCVIPGKRQFERRWRPEQGVNSTFYRVPYRSIIPGGSRNVLCAGRGAFGAARGMVNCNQMGEAAGTACRLALQNGCGVAEIDAGRWRRMPAAAGSAVL